MLVQAEGNLTVNVQAMALTGNGCRRRGALCCDVEGGPAHYFPAKPIPAEGLALGGCFPEGSNFSNLYPKRLLHDFKVFQD